MESTIRFVRPPGFADAIRSYRIVLDGRQVGTIARNTTLEVKVPAGTHSLEASVDWGRSKPLAVTTAPDQTIEVAVTNTFGAWLGIWAATFGRKRYLTLTPTS